MGVSESSRTPLFGRWQGGDMVFADQSKSTGRYFFVDSGSSTGADSGGYGASPDKPLLTLDYAIGQCEANRGDVIVLMPGHAETISAAADIVADIAGISIVGLGNGADRPTFTFDTDIGADIDITANGVKIENCIFYADIDALTNPLHIAAADFTVINCEFRDQSTKEAEAWILTTDAGDRLTIKECFHNGQEAGDACVNFARLVGVDDCMVVRCNFAGNYSTAVIEFFGTACTNVIVDRCSFLETGTTDFSKSIVDTVTGSVWSAVKCWDPAAGSEFSGGSGAALAADDVGIVSSKTDSVGIQTSTVDSEVESVGTQTESVGVSASTAISTGESVGIQASTIDSEVESVGTQTESVGVSASTAISASESVGVQVSTIDSEVESVGTQTESVGVSASTAISTGESVGVQTESVGVSASTAISTSESVGIQASTAISTGESVGIQASTIDSEVESVGTQTESVGVSASTAISSTESVGVQTSTAISTGESVGIQTSTVDSEVESVGTQAESVGVSASTCISQIDSIALVISLINSNNP